LLFPIASMESKSEDVSPLTNLANLEVHARAQSAIK
jgi:hypothetical protein